MRGISKQKTFLFEFENMPKSSEEEACFSKITIIQRDLAQQQPIQGQL